MEAGNKGALWRLVHSFSFKLVLLALILLSVPLILYWQFVHAEREQQLLLSRAVDQTNRVTAVLLTPRFARFSVEPARNLQDAMAHAAGGHTHIKVLMRLAGAPADDFLYVASQPVFPKRYLERERTELVRSGIFKRLAPTCDGTTNLGQKFINPQGTQEMLTAMTPVHVNGNCWVVISSENAASLTSWPVGSSFWNTPVLRTAAVIYLLSVVLLVGLFIQMWRNVERFRMAARRIRMQGAQVSFRRINTIPELTRVTEDFDSLVDALIASQKRTREAAEENSHALKTPLAVIAQSVEPLKRAVASGDAAAQRSIDLIERAVQRLDSMVNAYRDLENAAADLIFPPRSPTDLSALLRTSLPAYANILAAQGKRLAMAVDDSVVALASDELMEPVIENLLENAASFTPQNGTVEVHLEPDGADARLRVMDRGPGVAPELLPRIFDRATSFRAPDQEPQQHQGLGLWIVKRNIEALGGTVVARNRPERGLEVIVRLQLAG
ncbi:MAG: HAMP domain-containing histidine kinase [Proteobacteria bacterium]|nr:HAMP domain-containing histidine kinase [Pseudomonadota bacterium]